MNKMTGWQVLLMIGTFVACTVFPVPSPVFAACVPSPLGQVSWWPGDGDANDIVDGNHGTLHNGTTFATGMVDQAFRFDGVNDFVEVADADNLHLERGAFTIEMWVKLTGPDTEQYDLLEKTSAPTGIASGYIVHTLTTASGPSKAGVLRFCFVNADIGGRRCYDARRNIVDGQFHHIAVVKSGLNVKIYVDGRNDFAVLDHAVRHPVAAPVSMLLGKRRGNIDFVRGMIDEVGIFNRALSATTIRAIFTAGRGGKCKPPVGGTVTGVSPSRITCTNLTTGQTVLLPTGTRTWDCEAAGLDVLPGERIRQTITGRAY